MDVDIDNIPIVFIADLYGGQGSYDFSEQDVTLLPYMLEGSNNISFLIDSGDYDIPEDACMRIILNGDTKLLINELTVSEVTTENNNFYKPIYNTGSYTVYENPEAKPILYIPKQVECVENVKKSVNSDMMTSDLANFIYTDDTNNYDLSNSSSNISDINVEYNTVVGQVTADKNTFVIMTQAWYPGWKAYVDGENVPIRLVNGVVQGIEVPQGEHKIEFRFTSPTLAIGGIISISTFLIILYCLFRKKSSKM